MHTIPHVQHLPESDQTSHWPKLHGHTCSINHDSKQFVGNTPAQEQHRVAKMTHTAHTTAMLIQSSGVLRGASGPQPLETCTQHGHLAWASVVCNDCTHVVQTAHNIALAVQPTYCPPAMCVMWWWKDDAQTPPPALSSRAP